MDRQFTALMGAAVAAIVGILFFGIAPGRSDCPKCDDRGRGVVSLASLQGPPVEGTPEVGASPAVRQPGGDAASQNDRSTKDNSAMNASSSQSVSVQPQTAIFGAGCFWGVEAAFQRVPGVIETEVGYSGGKTRNATYKEVCTDTTGHAEVVRVKFDPAKVSYSDLVDVFFKNHNPTQVNRQGPDYGTQYRSAIFYLNDQQKSEAQARKAAWQPRFKKPIATEITKAGEFYTAEAYHQKYLEKRGVTQCHAPQYDDDDLADASFVPQPAPRAPTDAPKPAAAEPAGKVSRTDAEWKQILTPEQFEVLRNKGTERAFTGKYWSTKTPGTYVCAGCGAELFSSDAKFDSGCGWPSFDKALADGRIEERVDKSHGMTRTEVVCAKCGGHLGHLFDDGPTATGMRYCINSVSVDLKSKEQENAKK